MFLPITAYRKKDTVSRLFLLCSARQDALNDMHFDLFWPNLTLRSRDLRSNFDLDITGSNHTNFDASRRDEHHGV